MFCSLVAILALFSLSYPCLSHAQYVTVPSSSQPSGYCNPSVCWQDGSCYCTDRKDGWGHGGGIRVGGCASGSMRMCECDCYDTGTACQHLRCNDLVGIEKDGVCYSDAFGPWDRLDKARQNDCYKTQVNCKDVSGKCGLGEVLTGCRRTSPGSCTACAVKLPEKHFWTVRGVCEYAACAEGLPGYFFQTPCTNTSNAVSAPCSKHFGNTEASIDRAASLADALYYCPGQGRALLVPSNAMVTTDYTGFVCKPGFYVLGTSCYPCPRGYACPNGVAYQCPANYYSSAERQTSCARCRMGCPFASDVPLRCGVGSIQDAQCVACNACGKWPSSGLNCVLSDDVIALAQSPVCTPCVNPASGVAVCVENGCTAI